MLFSSSRGLAMRLVLVPMIGFLLVVLLGPLGCQSPRVVPSDGEGRTLLLVTSHPPGATVTLTTGEAKTTPACFAVHRSDAILTVMKEGYQPIAVKSWYRGSNEVALAALAGGVLAAGDAVAHRRDRTMRPNPISLELVPLEGELTPIPEPTDSISAFSASCSSPIEVGEDCSGWSGPSRSLSLRGADFLVSGSSESGGVLVMPLVDLAHLYTKSPSGKSLGAWAQTVCGRVIREGLEHGATLEEYIRIRWAAGVPGGCVLRFSPPIYEHLKTFTAEPGSPNCGAHGVVE